MDKDTAPAHLVCVVHGLMDSPDGVRTMCDALRQAHPPSSGVLVLASKANAGVLFSAFSTTKGIAAGGAALAVEVTQLLLRHPSINRFSFVGVSLGGQYARYALPFILEERPLLHLVNFITVASPWAGVRNHWYKYVGFTAVMGHLAILGRSGVNLVLADSEGEGGQPLLKWMADPASAFWRALARFQQRILISNTTIDPEVPYYSMALADSCATLHRLSRPEDGGDAALDCHFDRSVAASPLMLTRAQLFPGGDPSLASVEVDMSSFPHIACVFGQRPSDRGAGKLIAYSETADNRAPTAHYSLETDIINKLRLNGFMNIEVSFDGEAGGFLLNHLRICMSMPGLSGLGADVLAFVSKVAFIR